MRPGPVSRRALWSRRRVEAALEAEARGPDPAPRGRGPRAFALMTSLTGRRSRPSRMPLPRPRGLPPSSPTGRRDPHNPAFILQARSATDFVRGSVPRDCRRCAQVRRGYRRGSWAERAKLQPLPLRRPLGWRARRSPCGRPDHRQVARSAKSGMRAPTSTSLEAYAEVLGVDRKEYRKALEEVPLMSRHQVRGGVPGPSPSSPTSSPRWPTRMSSRRAISPRAGRPPRPC